LSDIHGSNGRKHRRRKSATHPIGASPDLIVVPLGASPTNIKTYLYDVNGVIVKDGYAPPQSGKICWIDIAGLADADAILSVSRELGLSDLTTAGIFQTDQRPHTEVLGEFVLTTMRMPLSALPYTSEQVTHIMGPNFVLSLRESNYDCFAPVRRRLHTGSGRIRSSSGYFCYALIDVVLDAWFPLLEGFGDLMETVEDQILLTPGDGITGQIHQLKRALLNVRRSIWPMREAISVLTRDDTPQIEDWMQPYLRDLSDHAFQALEMVEVYREVAQGLVDLHLSTLSNRMNEVMKVLTIISTIFMPITFLAGLYGMNFERTSTWNMPELGWKYGYFFALGLMAALAGTMFYFFRRIGWFGGGGKAGGQTQSYDPAASSNKFTD